jgi:hypothetical protein
MVGQPEEPAAECSSKAVGDVALARPCSPCHVPLSQRVLSMTVGGFGLLTDYYDLQVVK